MEDNKRKKTTGILLSVLGVLSLVLITAGVTYAFFSYAKEGQTVNTIRTGTIEFAYNETDGIDQGINISNAMPVDDNTGASVTSGDDEYGKLFRFTITSKTPSTAEIPYYVTIRKTDGTLGNAQVKVYLEETLADSNETATNYTYSGTKGENDFEVTTFADLLENHLASDVSTIGQAATASEAVMFTGTVPANQSDTYTNSFVLRMWLTGGENAGENAADYSPFEFMLKTATGATDATITTTTFACSDPQYTSENDCLNAEPAGTWAAKTITLPKAAAAHATAIDAEDAIENEQFITSTAYYALPSAAATNATPTGDGTYREDYERIAFVNTTDKTVYTLSQALLNNTATVDEFGNYTFDDVDNFTATEQYYRINGASFTAIVNVYADAVVVTP